MTKDQVAAAKVDIKKELEALVATQDPAISYGDSFWYICVICDPLGIGDPLITSLLAACAAFNAVTPFDSVYFTDGVCSIVTVDGRWVDYTVVPGNNPPATATFTVQTSDYYNEAEFNAIYALAQCVAALQFTKSLTGMDVTCYH